MAGVETGILATRVVVLAMAACLALLCLGCLPSRPTPPPETALVPVEPDRIPDFSDDLDPESLLAAMEQSRVYLRRLPGDRTFGYGPDTYTASHLLVSLDEFERIFRLHGPGNQLQRFIQERFIVYQSAGDGPERNILVTGYYEPLLHGSLRRGGPYLWPLYRLPDDLIEVHLEDFSADWKGRSIRGRLEGNRLVPYYSRGEIDGQGRLEGRGLELAWVDSPIDLLFLHIQGSGRIALDDGRVLQVGYAGGNGRPYRSIGAEMIERGLVPRDRMSMPAIRDWLASHPELARDLLHHNESYVFFRWLNEGPLGNINVPLTPGRSVALDHRIFPRGALGWMASRRPVVRSGQVGGWRDFGRFVLVQDTGGAIRGPARLDLFFGHGPDTGTAAGHMKEDGRMYFLVLKPAPAVPAGETPEP